MQHTNKIPINVGIILKLLLNPWFTIELHIFSKIYPNNLDN